MSETGSQESTNPALRRPDWHFACPKAVAFDHLVGLTVAIKGA
jgi:hypothetical protein